MGPAEASVATGPPPVPSWKAVEFKRVQCIKPRRPSPLIFLMNGVGKAVSFTEPPVAGGGEVAQSVY